MNPSSFETAPETKTEIIDFDNVSCEITVKSTIDPGLTFEILSGNLRVSTKSNKRVKTTQEKKVETESMDTTKPKPESELEVDMTRLNEHPKIKTFQKYIDEWNKLSPEAQSKLLNRMRQRKLITNTVFEKYRKLENRKQRKWEKILKSWKYLDKELGESFDKLDKNTQDFINLLRNRSYLTNQSERKLAKKIGDHLPRIDYVKHCVVVPINENPNGHSYELGLPISCKENGSDPTAFWRFEGGGGNSMTKNPSCVREATREEIIMFLLAHKPQKSCTDFDSDSDSD